MSFLSFIYVVKLYLSSYVGMWMNICDFDGEYINSDIREREREIEGEGDRKKKIYVDQYNFCFDTEWYRKGKKKKK